MDIQGEHSARLGYWSSSSLWKKWTQRECNSEHLRSDELLSNDYSFIPSSQNFIKVERRRSSVIQTHLIDRIKPHGRRWSLFAMLGNRDIHTQWKRCIHVNMCFVTGRFSRRIDPVQFVKVTKPQNYCKYATGINTFPLFPSYFILQICYFVRVTRVSRCEIYSNFSINITNKCPNDLWT